METILTVSQLNRYLKSMVEDDYALRSLLVRGEISNFTNHIKSGHFYFTLKEKDCSIRAVMFRTYAQRMRFHPENGMAVVAMGSVRFFERDGVTQLYCEELQPDGVGALALAFEQLKERLQKEGLFAPEHKKPIPVFPKRIGVVTSKTGAAYQDILNILSRRFPLGTVVLIPALVQGEQAPQSICSGIARAAEANLDVLIVGRGGGSTEDLWAFNDERVARAVYHCPVPVISAVGHEVDFTICDFVADLRAPTPSAAAELCAPDQQELSRQISGMQVQLQQRMRERILVEHRKLQQLQKRLGPLSPEAKINLASAQLERLQERLYQLSSQMIQRNMLEHQQLSRRLEQAAERTVEQNRQSYLRKVASLEALSPLKVLTRGYSITSNQQGKVLTNAEQVQAGQVIETRLQTGKVLSLVQQTILDGQTEKEEKQLGRKDV